MSYFENSDNFIKSKDIETILIKGNLNTKPQKVTIIIPTYKRVNLFKESLDSALQLEGFSDYEVLVIDNDDNFDMKTDTEILLDNYNDDRLFYYKNRKNLGMTGNWNRGIELARGEWLTILHDDDLLYPNFLKEMFEIIDNKDLDLLTCIAEVGNMIKDSISQNDKLIVKKIKRGRLIVGNINPAPGTLFKKCLAIQLGGFNNSYYPCMDYEFWVNYCLRYEGYMLNKKLSLYRIEDNESQRVNVRIEMTRQAYNIQTAILKKIKLPNFLKKIILFMTTGNLLNHYRNDQNFASDKSLLELEKELNIYSFYKNRIIFRIFQKIFYKAIFLIK